MTFLERPTFPRKTTSGLRRRLHAADPACHWCRVITVLYNVPQGQTATDDCATVDHVLDRRQCRDVKEHRASSNVVLACHRCNRERAYALDQARTQEAQRRLLEEPYLKRSIGNPLMDLTGILG